MNSLILIWISLVSILLLATSTLTQSSFDSNLVIQLYHSLDYDNPKDFTTRGNISVISINSAEVIVDQKELSLKERDALLRLAKDKKLYRLKAEVVSSDGAKNTYFSVVKASCLLQSQLHDFITISFDHNNAVLGISIRAVNLDSSSDDCTATSLGNANKFSTVVNLKGIEAAPQPDTFSFIQKLEREKAAREKGDTDNRSFLQKYWMYIVPAVIFLLVSGVTSPEAQGAAGR